MVAHVCARIQQPPVHAGSWTPEVEMTATGGPSRAGTPRHPALLGPSGFQRADSMQSREAGNPAFGGFLPSATASPDNPGAALAALQALQQGGSIRLVQNGQGEVLLGVSRPDAGRDVVVQGRGLDGPALRVLAEKALGAHQAATPPSPVLTYVSSWAGPAADEEHPEVPPFGGLSPPPGRSGTSAAAAPPSWDPEEDSQEADTAPLVSCAPSSQLDAPSAPP